MSAALEHIDETYPNEKLLGHARYFSAILMIIQIYKKSE